MIRISIDSQLKNAAPKLILGVIHAPVKLSGFNELLWREIDELVKGINLKTKLDMISHIPEIKALREAYRSIGKDPLRYRGSAEALLRRILKGKGLYKVNNLVDINNLVSLESLSPVGSYSTQNLIFPVVFRIGNPGETYKGIGKDFINIAGLPVFSDELGPFGSPTSDSERAMIAPDTKELMMIIISFNGARQIVGHLGRAVKLLTKYAGVCGKNIEKFLVE